VDLGCSALLTLLEAAEGELGRVGRPDTDAGGCCRAEGEPPGLHARRGSSQQGKGQGASRLDWGRCEPRCGWRLEGEPRQWRLVAFCFRLGAEEIATQGTDGTRESRPHGTDGNGWFLPFWARFLHGLPELVVLLGLRAIAQYNVNASIRINLCIHIHFFSQILGMPRNTGAYPWHRPWSRASVQKEHACRVASRRNT
jgi:hypothetical protein